MPLSADQQKAADAFSEFLLDPDSKVMVLQGHSGTGKSYLTNHLLELAHAQTELLKTLVNDAQELNFAVTATTNKAARVIGNATGVADAKTIHSYLGLRVKTDYRKGTTSLMRTKEHVVKENTLVIIDEASMMNNELLDMVKDSTLKCKLLYVGDPYQLTPVFEKTSPAFNQDFLTVKLESIQRQAEGSPIIQLADRLRHTVKTKEFFHIEPDNEKIIRVYDDEEMEEMLNTAFLEQEESEDCKVLAWTNKRVNQYNDHIRELFTDSVEPTKGEILVANAPVRSFVGDPDIVISNEDQITVMDAVYDEYEGIPGYLITTTDWEKVFMAESYEMLDNKLKQLAKIAREEKNWTNFYKIKETVADLRPVYASTVHKSQGSTYKKVFIDMADIGRCNITDEVARMLYVAITRSSDTVILYDKLPKKYGD